MGHFFMKNWYIWDYFEIPWWYIHSKTELEYPPVMSTCHFWYLGTEDNVCNLVDSVKNLWMNWVCMTVTFNQACIMHYDTNIVFSTHHKAVKNPAHRARYHSDIARSIPQYFMKPACSTHHWQNCNQLSHQAKLMLI